MNDRFKIDATGRFNPRQQVPHWEETAAAEAESRNDAMLGLAEEICGLKVKPLTWRHLLWLDIYQSPFLSEWPVEKLLRLRDIHLHVARFMWVLSPHWKPFSKVARWLYFRRYRKTLYGKRDVSSEYGTNTEEIVTAIWKFMEDSLWELKDDSRHPRKAGYFSSTAAAAHFLCRKFPALSPDPHSKNAAIDLPLKIYSQLLRAEMVANDPKAKAKMKNRTDALEQNWLLELNENLRKN